MSEVPYWVNHQVGKITIINSRQSKWHIPISISEPGLMEYCLLKGFDLNFYKHKLYLMKIYFMVAFSIRIIALKRSNLDNYNILKLSKLSSE